MFESHEQLIKHNMENHLAVKEKKIAELKTAIQEVENRLKTISTDKTEMSLNNEQLHSKNIALESDIASKTKTIINLQHQLEQQIAEFL
jgi:CII-binding regulator of phage lambda lysogenization HflD